MQTFSIDGELCSPEEARIPVTDHGLLYGDGVFEGLRFYDSRVLKLSAHLTRLQHSAAAIGLELPCTRESLRSAIDAVIEASPHDNGYIRVVVTRGVGPLGIDPRQCENSRLIIIADELTMVTDEARINGARLIIASTRRLAGDQLDSRIKSLNYLNQILARLEANAAGADEAVMLNASGHIAEGTADNIFIVSKGVLRTPRTIDGALDGITRGIILEIARELSIETREESLTTFDLYTADECFLTGTGAELIPVKEIAGRKIKQSPGPCFGKIQQGFRELLKCDAAFM